MILIVKATDRRHLLPPLVTYVMPFFYGAATRLPFIYFVIHLEEAFQLNWLAIGLYVGAYQGARALTNIATMFYPTVTHVVGTCLGAAGFAVTLCSDKTELVPFAAGTAIVGFSETVSSIQSYARDMFSKDLNQTKTVLRHQYASVMIGAVFAFLSGGIIYQRFGINGVATLGIIVEGIELVALGIYLVERARAKMVSGKELQTGARTKQTSRHSSSCDGGALDEGMTDSEEKGVSFSAPNESDGRFEYARESNMNMNELDTPKEEQEEYIFGESLRNRINQEFSGSKASASWVNYLLCATFGVEAITIGYNLSIGPVFVLTEFQKGPGAIGFLFAAGAGFGTLVATLITCTDVGRTFVNKHFPLPYNLYFSMGGIAAGVLLAAVPVFGVHVVGLCLLMAFNDIAATILTEMQASITSVGAYSVVGPLGQTIRRTLNVVTAVTGPILFGITPRLPYYVAGAVTVIWTVILCFLLQRRRERTVKRLSQSSGRNRQSIAIRMSFAHSENAASMNNSGLLSLKGFQSLRKLYEEDEDDGSDVDENDDNESDVSSFSSHL